MCMGGGGSRPAPPPIPPPPPPPPPPAPPVQTAKEIQEPESVRASKRKDYRRRGRNALVIGQGEDLSGVNIPT